MKRLIVTVGLLLSLASGANAQQQLVVPAFFPINPGGAQGDWSTNPDWVRIQNAGSAVKIVVALGDSGGLQGLTDAPGCTPGQCALQNARNQFNTLRAAPRNQLVFGYVRTAGANYPASGGFPASWVNGQPNVEKVIADVGAWRAAYPSQIDGIFFDEGPMFSPTSMTDQQYRDWYTKLFNEMRLRHPWAKIMLNVAGFPNEWVLGVADSVLTWEESVATYVDAALYKSITPGGGVGDPPAWWTSAATSGRGAVTLHHANASQIYQAVTTSRGRGAPMIYMFDGTSSSYSALPSFFEQLVAAMQPCAGPSATQDHYVDQLNGNDALNQGNSRTCPYKTFSYALQNAKGGTVYLKGGHTYVAGQGGEAISFASYDSISIDCSGDANRDPARGPAPYATLQAKPSGVSALLFQGLDDRIFNCVIDAAGSQDGIQLTRNFDLQAITLRNTTLANYTIHGLYALSNQDPFTPQWLRLTVENNSFQCAYAPGTASTCGADIYLEQEVREASTFSSNVFGGRSMWNMNCGAYASPLLTGRGNVFSSGGTTRAITCQACANCPF